MLKDSTVAIINRGVRGVFICGLMNDALVYEVERYKRINLKIQFPELW